MTFSRPFYRPFENLRRSATGDLLEMHWPGSRQSDLVVLDGDTLASLVAPGLDDQPTASRLHPRTKSVGLCPMPVIRLVCSLWHSLVLLENLKSYTAWRSPSRNAQRCPLVHCIHTEGDRHNKKEQYQRLRVSKVVLRESHRQESR